MFCASQKSVPRSYYIHHIPDIVGVTYCQTMWPFHIYIDNSSCRHPPIGLICVTDEKMGCGCRERLELAAPAPGGWGGLARYILHAPTPARARCPYRMLYDPCKFIECLPRSLARFDHGPLQPQHLVVSVVVSASTYGHTSDIGQDQGHGQ